MRIQSAISIIALASALVAGPAFAQSMTLGGNAVAEADVAAVQARCDALKLESEASLVEQSEKSAESGEVAEGEAVPAEGEAADGNAGSEAPAVNGMDQATSTIDLETVTLEDCEGGGWLAK
ncbi:MAG: hypothetical protein ABS75_14205 [Pelagibacterium sp. SCN 63-23]|nr:MAG: hypothetical protein ABS75_14205 [Pelagibacterium sp. SCN 63-23]